MKKGILILGPMVALGLMVAQGMCAYHHIDDTLNPYGKAYYDNGRNADAIRAIDDLDSDGDKYTNKAEIAANRFPGNANDDPSQVTAPYRIYTRAQLEALSSHTQFMF